MAEGGRPIASVLCKMCGRSSTLGVKCGKVLISNWTRHIIKCVQISTEARYMYKLDKHFSSPSPQTSCASASSCPPSCPSSSPELFLPTTTQQKAIHENSESKTEHRESESQDQYVQSQEGSQEGSSINSTTRTDLTPKQHHKTSEAVSQEGNLQPSFTSPAHMNDSTNEQRREYSGGEGQYKSAQISPCGLQKGVLHSSLESTTHTDLSCLAGDQSHSALPECVLTSEAAANSESSGQDQLFHLSPPVSQEGDLHPSFTLPPHTNDSTTEQCRKYPGGEGQDQISPCGLQKGVLHSSLESTTHTDLSCLARDQSHSALPECVLTSEAAANSESSGQDQLFHLSPPVSQEGDLHPSFTLPPHTNDSTTEQCRKYPGGEGQDQISPCGLQKGVLHSSLESTTHTDLSCLARDQSHSALPECVLTSEAAANSESSGQDQLFHLSPPVSQEGDFRPSSSLAPVAVQPSPNLIPHTDWSRKSRHGLSLLKSAADYSQCKITSFLDVVEKVTKLIPGMLQTAHSQRTERKISNISPLLKQLLMNAEKNAQKLPQQRRHEQVLKKFATSLFIFSGPLTYQFLYCNLPEALPSLRTVQRIVSCEYQPLHKGEFRYDELLVHLNSYNAPMVVAVG